MGDDESKTPFHNPFAVLSALRGDSREALEPEVAADPTTPAVPRAVVRMERSGRRGKEVTVIEHLTISADARERWLKELRAALGCGGSVEGDAIALQGDQRKRLPKLLAARGVKKITVA
jgi:translation initiation factor 1